MSEDSRQYKHPKIFKSASIQLSSAILTEIPEATLLGFEEDPLDKKRRVILISYSTSQEFKVSRVIREFENKVLTINLFYYNRNLNFLRDRLFNKRSER